MLPTDLLKILAVPGTDRPLTLVVREVANGEPYSGWLEDDSGHVWGRLDGFRFFFVNFEPISETEREKVRALGPTEARVPIGTPISALDDRIEWVGNPFVLEDYLKGFHGDRPGSSFVLRSTSVAVELLLHAHGWSGIATVMVNDEFFAEIDLFNREMSVTRKITVPNPEMAPLEIRVSPTGRASVGAQGSQLILEGFVEYTGLWETPVYAKSAARNRGGQFRPRFFEILDGLDDNAIVLDVGGGKRQIDDPRYINLEYSLLEEPDIFGDATALPFKSDSIDFLYTAAVLEHVRDPLKMGREIHRVLKDGGRVLANSAFMQPVHSEGQHFFNLTPYGIDLTFEMFQDRSVWWEGAFSYTMKWFLEVTGLKDTVEQWKIDSFLGLATEFENKMSYDRQMYVASGVWLEGRK